VNSIGVRPATAWRAQEDFALAPRRYARSDKGDFAGHVGFGLLVLVTLFSLRVAIWHATSITLHLIDLALSSEPLLTAERLNEGADQRWSVSVLVIALPLFLGGFAILAHRLEDDLPIARSRILIAGLALLFLDTLVGLLGADLMSIFNLTSERSMDAALLKMTATTLILGAVLGYAGWEISRAARS
jgi:hypothetical protein